VTLSALHPDEAAGVRCNKSSEQHHPTPFNTIQHHPAPAVPAAPAALATTATTATSSNLWLCRCDLLARCSKMTDRTGAGRARRGHCHSRHDMRDSAALFWLRSRRKISERRRQEKPGDPSCWRAWGNALRARPALNTIRTLPFASRAGLGSTVS